MNILPFPLCDKYLIYEDGRIFSKHRNRFLKPELNRGYHRTNLSGIRYMWHRVVALTFVPNPQNKPFINHKDRIRINNHKDNLEWCTQKENMQHAYSDGTNLKNRGENNGGGGKLTSQDVLGIKKLLSLGETISQEEIAKLYNVSACMISGIYYGKRWKHIGDAQTSKERYKSTQTGSNNPSSKLTNEQVVEIRQLIKDRLMSQQEIANRYSVSKNTISRISTGRHYKN